MKHYFTMIFLLLFMVQPVFAQKEKTSEPSKKQPKQKEVVAKKEDFYIGGGVSFNDLDGFDDSIGLQVFFGYDLPAKLRGAKLSVEVGYWDSGEYEKRVPSGRVIRKSSDGLWAALVMGLHLSQTTDLLFQVGLDFGEEDGVMAGIGLGFDLNPQQQLRVELVGRDETDSLLVNFVHHF